MMKPHSFQWGKIFMVDLLVSILAYEYALSNIVCLLPGTNRTIGGGPPTCYILKRTTFQSGGKDMTIYFYKQDEKPYGCFSNFSRHGFELDSAWWPTSEHYFQAQKFAGTPYVENVRIASSPKAAAELGRDRKLPLRPDWEQVKDDIMRKAVLRKFETHADLRATLLGTGHEDLVEKTTYDYYWGCGTNGTGKNMLGHILMQVREILRNRNP